MQSWSIYDVWGPYNVPQRRMGNARSLSGSQMGDNTDCSCVPVPHWRAGTEVDWLTLSPPRGLGYLAALYPNQAPWGHKLSFKLLVRCLIQSCYLTTILCEALSEELWRKDNRVISAIAGPQMLGSLGESFQLPVSLSLPLSLLHPAVVFKSGYSLGSWGIAWHCSKFTEHKLIVCVGRDFANGQQYHITTHFNWF